MAAIRSQQQSQHQQSAVTTLFRALVVLLLLIAVWLRGSLPDYNNSSSSSLMTTTTASVASSSASSNTASSSSYALASRDSFGFFDDITDADWTRYKQRYHAEPLLTPQSFQNDPASGTDVAYWLMYNVDPNFSCAHLRRIGGRDDGRKWICDPHRLAHHNNKNCLVYSVGSFGNYRFEEGLIEAFGGTKACEIHVFDPEPKYARAGDPETKNIHYHAWGLKSSYMDTRVNNAAYEFLSLQDTQQRLGHAGRRIDIFKIDCEGCEWTSYKDWLSDSVDIRQVQIEIHGLKNRPSDVTLAGFFQAFLDRGLVPFYKEANMDPKAKPPGTLLEYAFIKLAPSFFEKQ